jgi:hypothetical protein
MLECRQARWALALLVVAGGLGCSEEEAVSGLGQQDVQVPRVLEPRRPVSPRGAPALVSAPPAPPPALQLPAAQQPAAQ